MPYVCSASNDKKQETNTTVAEQGEIDSKLRPIYGDINSNLRDIKEYCEKISALEVPDRPADAANSADRISSSDKCIAEVKAIYIDINDKITNIRG